MRNMNDILRQAQVMQNKLAKLQNELNERTYEASSGGGMVKAVAQYPHQADVDGFDRDGGADGRLSLVLTVRHKKYRERSFTTALPAFSLYFGRFLSVHQGQQK